MMHSAIGVSLGNGVGRTLVARGLLGKAGLLLMVLALACFAGGCAAQRAYASGKTAASAGEWDVAVEQYRQALIADPDNTEYRIALQRAMNSASVYHAERGRNADLRGQLEEALREYKRASEYDPANRQYAAKAAELDRKLRELAEAAAPKPPITQLREQARQQAAAPASFRLNELLPALSFANASVRDILLGVGKLAGINVTFERDYNDQNRPYSVEMDGVTLEQALNQITLANQLFYKVLNPRTILVINDNAQKRQAYDEQVIQTFRLSHADAVEVQSMVQQVVRITAAAQVTQFQISANKTQNTITVRAPLNIIQIMDRVIDSVDTPKAEVIVEVEILEVRKSRLKQYGLDLGNYTIGAVYSPEVDPRGDSGLTSPPFNLNTPFVQGINRGDFYLAVPSAAIRFLESDNNTKLLAKTQLRGAEGQEMTLNLGEDVPVPTTVYTPIAQGGANVNPLSSFNYRTVGIVLKATPRVTYENEILITMEVENSARGADSNVGGTNLPTFATRKVTGQLRLRDGEPNLLAGLLQENERKQLRGVVGLLRLPVIRQLFSANDETIEQTDIIMLMTPRIIRSHELKASDLEPLFIGTAANPGVGGPPPLILQPAVETPTPGAPAPPPAPAGVAPAPAPAPAPPIPGAPQPNPPGATPGAAPGAAPTTTPAPPPGANATPLPAPLAAGPPGPPTTGATTATAAAPSTGSTSAALLPAGPGTQIVISPSATDLRVGTTGYQVPIMAVNASRLSSVTLTVTYNPAALRVRSIQQGSFMSTAGTAVAFQQNANTPGRIDMVLTRTGDSTGAAGTGLLASILFDAIGAGPANLTVTGSATAPGGGALPLQFGGVPPMTVR
jgi:general secretion pathway protein D